MNKTILLTGGAGYIGSHTCVELILRGYKVIIFDSLVNSTEKNITRIKKIVSNKDKRYRKKLDFIKGDIRDKDSLEKLFFSQKVKNAPIDAVMHFAGLKSIKESNLNSLEYWDVNVAGAISLIKAMEKNSCEILLFSSSAAIYSSDKEVLFKENSLINPSSPYGETKAAVEKLLENYFYSRFHKISLATLRYTNPIGAHESGLLGDEPASEATNILPIINKVASGKMEYFSIYGDDWPTNDGTAVRDYIHVVDLAKGHIKTLEYLNKNQSQFIKLNIGTGKGTSVKELIKTFEKVNKVKIPYKYEKRRKGDSAVSIVDNTLIKEKIGWIPKFNLEKMCSDAWRSNRLN